MSAWTYRCSNGKAAPKIVPPRLRIPYWKGLGADSEEKHEPASDIDTVVVDNISLKMLDSKRPIREADFPHSSAGSARAASFRSAVALPTGTTSNASRSENRPYANAP